MYRNIADTWAARLLMICFFLPMTLQVTVLITAALWLVIGAVIGRHRSSLAAYGWAIAISATYYLYLIAFPFTPARFTGQLAMLCGNKLSYVLMPFFFAAISAQARALIRAQLPWFVYGCVACCLIANGRYLCNFSFTPGAIQHLYHADYRLYIENVSGIHPTYMSMYICFAMCILLTQARIAGMPNWVKYTLLYMLVILLLSLLAKSALLAICIIMVHYAWVQRHVLLRYKLQLAAGFTAIGIALYFIPFFGQRMGEVLQFAGIGAKRGGDISDNSMYVRKVIWSTDMQMLHHYWLGGVGPGALSYALSSRYFFFSIVHTHAIGYYDCHNQYLNEWLSFGLIGIMLLVIVMLLHLTRALRRADHLYLYLLIIFLTTFATETVLARQYGVVFYAVLTSMFFFTPEAEDDIIALYKSKPML